MNKLILYEESFVRKEHRFTVGVCDNGSLCYSIDGSQIHYAKEISDKGMIFHTSEKISIEGKEVACTGIRLEPDIRDRMIKIQNEVRVRLKKEEEERKSRVFDAVMKGDSKVGYLTIEHADQYGCELTVARRLTEEEKEKYAEWYRDIAFVSHGIVIKLPYIGIEDLPDRKPDGAFPSRENRVWIISPEEWRCYIELNNQRKLEKEAAKAAKQAEEQARRNLRELKKKELLAKVDSWEVREAGSNRSEDRYVHTFKINGKKLVFAERNVFDVGKIINPLYSVLPGVEPGGLCVMENGKPMWDVEWLIKDVDGLVGRELTEEEKVCMEILDNFGEFANAGIRM